VTPFYQDDYATIYHGDCREILPHLPKVDLVLTDPPFSEYTHSNAKSNRDLGYGNKASCGIIR
jgi:DNA modification methylase